MNPKNTTKKTQQSPLKLGTMFVLLQQAADLVPPLSSTDKKNLAQLGSYLERYYAHKTPTHVMEYKDLRGQSIKTLNVMEKDAFVCREDRKDGPVFWIRCGDGERDFAVCTDGKSVIEYPPEVLSGDDNYWILREYSPNGNYIETRREPNKMTISCYDRNGKMLPARNANSRGRFSR